MRDHVHEHPSKTQREMEWHPRPRRAKRSQREGKQQRRRQQRRGRRTQNEHVLPMGDRDEAQSKQREAKVQQAGLQRRE